MADIQIINPIEYPNWDDLLLTNDETSFFHTSAWARVLSESYNYIPLYFAEIEYGKLISLIPVMEVNSILTGKKGVSLPFTDYCLPISRDESHFSRMFGELIEHGKIAKWKHLIIRSANKYYDESIVSERFIEHSLKLPEDEKDVFNTFRGSTCRNIKKAIKENINVAFSYTWKATEIYYRLHCITRKMHGLPPQPKFFFRKLFKHVISRNKGFVTLATWKDTPVAGGIFVHFGEKAIFKFGASDPNYHYLRPNNLLMWRTIQHYLSEGFRHFSFGKTEPLNKGLLQFKRGWGVREQELSSYKYDLKNNFFISKGTGIKSSYNIFKVMPIPILRLVGSLLYRHVG